MRAMNGVDELIASFTERQHGLIARWQSSGVGITKRQFDARVVDRVLIRVYRDVYRLRGVPFTQELRWLAGVLAGGDGAALSHRAAGALHHYDIRRSRPEVTTPHRRHPEIEGVTLHRTRRHNPIDLVVVNRIPVTTKARTMLDLAGILPYETFLALLQDAVARGVANLEPLMAIVDRRGGHGVEGTVALRTGLADGLVDEKIESKLELIIAGIVDAARVPTPVRQHEMTCADGREVRLDNAWIDLKVAVEGDGRRWHGSAKQARASRARSRSIVASGWQHYVYGWAEATETPLLVRAEVEETVLGPMGYRRAS